jgi:hypothetical protein
MEKEDYFKKPSQKEEHDTKIGHALVKAMQEMAEEEPCPSSKDISLFLDGKLKGERRDALLSHLTCCSRCYDAYLIAYEMNREEGEISIKEKKSRTAFLPYAVTASLLLTLISYFAYQHYFIPDNQTTIVQQELNNRETEPVYYAMVDLDSNEKSFLMNNRKAVIKDKGTIHNMLNVFKIKKDALKGQKINEVRIEWPETEVKAFFIIKPERAELVVKEGVLTIKILK